MSRFRTCLQSMSLLSLSVLALALPAGAAMAQAAASRPIEQQMTPAEFSAAGLQKLTPEELSRLNAWLGRTIDSESTKAAAKAQDRIKNETRGFFNFGSSEPIASTLVGEFRGYQRGRVYVLANGQEWRQIEDASLAGVRKTNPAVKVTPGLVGNAWYLIIDGYNSRAKVVRIR